MKKTLLILPICAALTLTGCSNMSKTEQTTLSGGATEATSVAEDAAKGATPWPRTITVKVPAAGLAKVTTRLSCWAPALDPLS